MAYARIRPRRGTEYEWSTYDPVLAEGELAVQFPDTGIGTGLCKFKVGDGITAWNQLPFAFDGTAAASIDGGGVNPNSLIQIRTATANAWYNTNPILVEKEIAYCSDPDINSIKIGDGNTRWNSLPYIKASALIDNSDNYDFGSEDDGEEVMSLSNMEDYVTYNSDYEANVFENYGRPTPSPEPDPDEPTPDPVNLDDSQDTPGEEETPQQDEGPEEEPVVETAGLRDLMKSADSTNVVEDSDALDLDGGTIAEEIATTKKSRKSKK